ncbi:hypothetical protein AMAG_06602 [Allomyces macrogynus ATCC 38327]|uniref:Cytosol aminopeptidase domain-containing protein n=1 Tax=Allomyces macrogynus (strain ATCC 38327) TaxID=578462 RepID=A0A0L0SEC7_ALLM3|nr:hypothetical protein AMAG_06602 [Allomyces macrogynus ATCC 38327]|eukprot:KNE60836.1 hypothetical protein AMAG_06602 [Allomyces macrogynus ATCC 38327]
MIRTAAAAALRRRACAAPAIRPATIFPRRCYTTTTTTEPAKRSNPSSASAPPPPPEPRIDGAVVGCYAGERPSLEHLTAAALAVNERAHHALFMQLEHSGFRGNAGECRVLYPAVSALDHVGEPVLDEVPPRVAVVGLGKRPVGEEKGKDLVVDEAAERARRAAAIGVKALKDTGARTIAIEPFLPTTPTDHARAEGAVLRDLLYVEVHYRGRGEDQPVDVGRLWGGAATVLSAVHGLARLGTRVNVTALIPLCENMPSSSATKPGDVVRAANGLTIEIDNTDAEGRLLLGDALFHATSFHARSAIIDVATLTGAMDVALGRQYSGVFTNSDALWMRFARAARVTGDKAWRMPLDDGYLDAMKSHVADLKNAGDRSAGACTAAIFLKQFLAPADPEVGTAKVEGEEETHPVVQAGRAPTWAHVDIAGVMHYGAAEGVYNVKGMSGRPTRLLMELVRLVGEEPIVEEGSEGVDA